jgi:hypothetical protein
MGHSAKGLWVNKPPGKENVKLTDFFDVAYHGIPHKIYAAAAFNAQIDVLRSRFYDPKDAAYLIKPTYHKGVPADGFPRFAEAIWEKIVNNRDLDLPTQQQLLAQYRCDEISKQVLEKFGAAAKEFKAPLESGRVLEDFGKKASETVTFALELFDKDASRYNAQVYQVSRGELANRMYTTLHVFYVMHLKNTARKGLGMFQTTIDELLKKGVRFSDALETATTRARSFFVDNADSGIVAGSEWTYEDTYSEFRDEIEKQSVTRKKEALVQVQKTIDTAIKGKIAEPVSQLLNDASPSLLWERVVKVVNDVVSETEALSRDKLLAIGITSDLVDKSISTMKLHAWERMIKVARDELADVPLHEKLRRKYFM